MFTTRADSPSAPTSSTRSRSAASGVVVVLVAVLQIITTGCTSGGCNILSKGEHTMSSSKAEDILERMEKTGKLGGAQIEHYVGGGAPPPYLHNDQLRLFAFEGREVLQFAQSNYARTEFNPYALDKYRLPAEPADIRTMARLILATKAFGAHTSQEGPSNVPDMIRTELIVTEGGESATRIYYGQVPAALEPLEKEVDAMVARLKEKGEYGLYDGDRKIASAVRP